MECLNNLSGDELVLFAAISISIAKNLDADELDALGNFFLCSWK